jgi:hypothetical protein
MPLEKYLNYREQKNKGRQKRTGSTALKQQQTNKMKQERIDR